MNENLTIIRSKAGVNNRKSMYNKLMHYLTFMISGIINVTKIKKNYDIVIVSSPTKGILSSKPAESNMVISPCITFSSNKDS